MKTLLSTIFRLGWLSNRKNDGIMTEKENRIQSYIENQEYNQALELINRELIGQGKFEEAIKLLEFARKKIQPNSETDSLTSGKIYQQLGACYIHLLRYREADNALNQALSIFTRLEIKPAVAGVKQTQGVLNYYRRNLDQALKCYEASEQLFTECIDNCLEESDKIPLLIRQARVRNAMAMLFMETGQFGRAENLLLQIKNTFENSIPRSRRPVILYGQLLSNLSSACREQSLDSKHKHRLAQQYAYQAIRHFKQSGNDFQLMNAYWPLGQLYFRHGRYKHALKWFAKAEELSKEVEATAFQMNYQLNQALCYQELGQLDSASSLFQQVMEWEKQHPTPWLAALTYAGLGRIFQIDRDPNNALEHFDLAIGAVESLRATLSTRDDFISGAMHSYVSIYEAAISYCLEDLDDKTLALEYMERARSRQLLDLLLNRLRIIDASDASFSEIRERINQLYQQINLAQTQPGARILDVQQIQQEIEQAETKIQLIFKRFRDESPAWRDGLNPKVIQKKLTGTVIEYFICDEELLALVINSDQIDYIKLGSVSLLDDIYLLNYQLRHFLTTSGPIIIDSYLSALYELLIAPLGNQLKSPLTIIPYGLLHYLPFQALLHNGAALIDQFAVRYAPSLKVFDMCRRKSRKIQAAAHDYPAVLVGVPHERTPLVRTEIERLHAIFPDAKILYGPDATWENIHKYADKCRYLHFSSHAFFNEQNPLFSAIRLHDNQFLTVNDLYQLKLNTRLVTLSACETARNHILAGDELVGLMRGFLYAQTPAILMSQWLVLDQITTQLTPFLYERLEQGEDLPVAFQQAQVSLKETNPNVYYWAPFVLVGS